jgi:hypothetical protein
MPAGARPHRIGNIIASVELIAGKGFSVDTLQLKPNTAVGHHGIRGQMNPKIKGRDVLVVLDDHAGRSAQRAEFGSVGSLESHFSWIAQRHNALSSIRN